MNILITGSKGFIAQNLISHLDKNDELKILEFSRNDPPKDLELKVTKADFICHFAGVNRSDNDIDFVDVNIGLTEKICELASKTGNKIPLLLTSSVHAEQDTPYGKSKLAAEQHLIKYSKNTGAEIFIFRLKNVFGKWCRPNYNSVVATFCHNVAKGLSIKIHDRESKIELIYIDDFIDEIINIFKRNHEKKDYYQVEPTYQTSVGELAEKIYGFKESRTSLVVDDVGIGLTRALYATYLSYLEENDFSYKLPEYNDERGQFSEILKTSRSGQISFFTSKPGISRGCHYHHTKSEKFLVVQGEAEFSFQHIQNGRKYQKTISSITPEIVETIPGWIHEITNIGDIDLIVFLWANEIFDRKKPDTYSIG